MARVLVTGGAGYIGQHVCKSLIARGHVAIVLDNYSNDRLKKYPPGYGDCVGLEDINHNSSQIADIMTKRQVDVVIHLAGKIESGVSNHKPEEYYDTNVRGTLNVLKAMRIAGLNNLVFASSAAVYFPSINDDAPHRLEEDDMHCPQSVYGRTKLMGEQMIEDYAAGDNSNLYYYILRLFNVAGADGDIGESHALETHLIPRVINAALTGEKVPIYVGQHVTNRDYVHVKDVARAFVLAVEKLVEGNDPCNNILNICSESRVSPLDVICHVESITGKSLVDVLDMQRASRDDDYGDVVGWASAAFLELGWKPVYSVREMVESAYEWHKQHN